MELDILSSCGAWVCKSPKLALSGSSVEGGYQPLLEKLAEERVLDFKSEELLMGLRPSSLGLFGEN